MYVDPTILVSPQDKANLVMVDNLSDVHLFAGILLRVLGSAFIRDIGFSFLLLMCLYMIVIRVI